MAAAPAWRQFSFFTIAPVKDAHDLASSPDIFKTPTEIAATASSSVGLLVADIHGSVHSLNKEFEPTQSWVAHVGGRVTHMIARKNVLVTLGEEESSRMPLLKIWNLEQTDKKSGSPLLLRSVKVQHGNRSHPVSTIALSNNLTHLAVGLADGTVLLYRHLSSSLQPSSSLTSLPKPRIIHESPTEPITGLGFREASEDVPHIYLFIVTITRTLTYMASAKGSGASSATAVDEVGCALGCATMDWQAKEMIVARDEAIYLCGTDGRGACYAFEGHKSSVQSHLNYLVIVSPPMTVSASHASATVRHFAARSSTSADITKLTVFDIENKFVAYSGTFIEGVKDVFCEWGQIFVLSNDGKLSSLQEKPTTTKLDILFHKSLYVLAINLARTQSLDEASIADIHRRYGDHLYLKGDYDGAMQQFIKTLGYLQPSYVIRKFLDAQRIHNLTTYLQELHSLGFANSDHTTLLLNTYTKLKDVSRLDSFIKAESHRPSSGDKDELPFDLETAIRVCRQAGYFEHASYLAKKYERHEDYLRIQIEDAENYRDALGYVRSLGPESAQAILVRYGRPLLAHLPDETTSLLIDICSGAPMIASLEQEEAPSAPIPKAAAGPSYLSYLALTRGNAALGGISIPTGRSDSPALQGSMQEGSRTSSPRPSVTTTRLPPPVRRPSPQLYFAHFVDHPACFVRFLEAVALRRWGQSVEESSGTAPSSHAEASGDDRSEQTAVWNTLLELYLSLSANQDSLGMSGLRDKSIQPQHNMVIRLLQNDRLPYDPTQALIVCSTRAFTPGLVLLWEKMGMYEDVLRFWMDKDKEGSDPEASAQVLRHLNIYGPTHPHLYPLVLRFLTSNSGLLSRHTSDLALVLEHIDRERIMPPLGIVQVLSRNSVASVGLVKQWLMAKIQDSQNELQADRGLINSYRTETKAKLQEISELSDPHHPRAFQATRCSACGGQLDLPSVHFMCKHSYHQRCVADHETECPNCAQSHGVIREIRRNNERLADQHDLFLGDVAERGFNAVAAGFGRGVLNKSQEIPIP
ncbi:hypothetical protein JB92DRAFT_3084586 [Gautieria morchelliformis]|nr:hypothetical protein JB92DRAFT_3084586 [Gautieria morchelliformis]